MSGGRVAVVAALPREVAGLVKGLREEPSTRPGVHLWRAGEAVVVAAGMGATRVALAVEAALHAGGVGTLISAGLAGACSAAAPVGAVIEAATVVDVQTGERFAATGAAGSDAVVLATAPAIASVAEKARLAAGYGAAMVDMEAATVARLARAHGLEFRAVKAVSDAQDFELKGLARFAGADGEFRTGAFALYTAVRPGSWRGAMQLGANSRVALRGLTARLREILAETR